jgi:transcription elongation factor S-II
MSKINDAIEFRKNIINNLKNKLKENNYITNDCENEKLENNEIDEMYTKYAKNLEKGIYNYCINQSTERNIVKKWENQYFVHLYVDRLRSIYMNINSESLKDKVINNTIKIHEIAFMNHQEMQPIKWHKLLEDKKIRDEYKYAPKIEASTDNFTCWKCKSKACTYYQLQTRSADEPMTTFVTCINCGQRWKC